MIRSYKTNQPYRLVDNKTYAVMLEGGSVEVLKWINGLGWRRLDGEYISGDMVDSVIRSVRI